MSTFLYIVLGVVSFALVAFLTWATWNGGRKEKTGPRDEPEQPTPIPEPPHETASQRPQGPAGRA